MSRFFQFALCVLFFGFWQTSSRAAFTSLFVFGDGVCTTTNGPGGTYYHGRRYCNGRVWVEVLAERQGLAFESSRNWSYYGHYSSHLVTNVGNFVAPPDASNALFIIWCADADFVWNVQNYGANLTQWANAINQSLTNHFKAVTNLYHAKGARTVVMLNAVDLIKVPFFSNYTDQQAFVRQRTMDFNAAFATTLINQIKTDCPDLTVFVADIFTLFNDLVAQSASYGLMKPETFVFNDLPSTEWALNGPGTNYVFWDDLNPTAKAHAVIADFVQQMISPVQFDRIMLLGNSNQLDLVDVPLGLVGFVEETTNFVNWASAQTIPGTNAPQTIFLPTAGPERFYRLRFPYAWSWP